MIRSKPINRGSSACWVRPVTRGRSNDRSSCLRKPTVLERKTTQSRRAAVLLRAPSAMPGPEQGLGLGPHSPPPFHALHKPAGFPVHCLKNALLSVREVSALFLERSMLVCPRTNTRIPSYSPPPIRMTHPKPSFVPSMFLSLDEGYCVIVQVSLKTLQPFHGWWA